MPPPTLAVREGINPRIFVVLSSKNSLETDLLRFANRRRDITYFLDGWDS
jgi:hypothetical protein